MPQEVTFVNLRAYVSYGIISGMTTLLLDADAVPETSRHQIFTASRVDLNLTQPPRKFFRHGWQSWTLAAWLDPSEPPLPIRAPEFRAKDEDPAYALHKNHVSAWVGAVELEEDDILLVGSLDLSGRIELSGCALKGFYEDAREGEWLVARGKEDEVFETYASLLESKFGKTRFEKPPRVWCSWYSLLKWISEPVLLKILRELGDLPFDVFQIDDGWQDASGYWEAGKKFPSGMEAFADKVKATGRAAGIWLSPLMVSPNSQLAKDHPDWLLRDENEMPVPAGITWGGNPLALDATHPEVRRQVASSAERRDHVVQVEQVVQGRADSVPLGEREAEVALKGVLTGQKQLGGQSGGLTQDETCSEHPRRPGLNAGGRSEEDRGDEATG